MVDVKRCFSSLRYIKNDFQIVWEFLLSQSAQDFPKQSCLWLYFLKKSWKYEKFCKSKELSEIIDKVVEEVGAESMKDMGKVISKVNEKVFGQAEGRVIAEIIKNKLMS